MEFLLELVQIEEPCAPDIRIFELEDDDAANKVYKDDIVYEDEELGLAKRPVAHSTKLNVPEISLPDSPENGEGAGEVNRPGPDRSVSGAISGFMLSPGRIMASTMHVSQECIDLSCKGSDD